MENTIDRKAYRRNAYDNYERKETIERIEIKRSNSLFLVQIINAMLILLFVLLLKFFYFEEEFNFVKEKFNSGYSYETIKEVVSNKFGEMTRLRAEINEYTEKSGEKDFNILIGETIIGSGDDSYITAVEGVNQLLDDSNNVKEKYKMRSPLNGVITSEFGCRESDNPIISTYHNGLDIAANSGTNIYAAHSGNVTFASNNGTYGNCIIIESGDLSTLYAHCLELSVKKGDAISLGQNIGKVGMTGNATGPHLHFEVKYQDRYINPQDVIEIGGK